MCFNVIAKNCDDHVKNISFLMDKTGKWDLSPAYDVTYAYDPASRWLSKHQMSIAGKREDFGYEDLLKSGTAMNISGKRAEDILYQVVRSVRRWEDFAAESEVPENRVIEISEMFEKKIMDRY